MRQQNALAQAEVRQRFHFAQPLFGGFSRVGRLAFIAQRGDVAVRQASVVVGWPNQAIQVHFKGGHRFIPGAVVSGLVSVGLSIEATG